MLCSKICRAAFALLLSLTAAHPLQAAQPLAERATAAITLLDSAEGRFVTPDTQWYETTRQALAEEASRVGAALDAQGEQYAAAWKNHLRWSLLVSNLGAPAEINYDELALVRRWMYSNRKGLEYPFFAELRRRMDNHLDAAYTFSQPDIEQSYLRHLAQTRLQIAAVSAQPTDANMAALGRTLGWLERTKQLPDEISALRALLSTPNAQITVTKPVIDRGLAMLASDVEQSLPVSDRVRVNNAGLLNQSRMVNVRGIAHTQGHIGLEITENPAWADLQLVYQGQIESNCRAIVGPVTVAMQTLGPVKAITPMQISLQGVQLLDTEVYPQVRTRVTSVQARGEMLRRIGQRRVNQPESVDQMNSRASQKAESLLREEMGERIDTAIDQIVRELRKSQASMDQFKDVLAPVLREGANPHWVGITSTTGGVTVNVASQRREQLGAPAECPIQLEEADVQASLHVSFFNNMAETIMAGKTFTDEYFMNYGKILQANLPPTLMVHSRSERWAVVAAKPRPLEITIPAPNQFRIELRLQRVEVGDERFTGPTIATIHYELVKDDFDEYHLERRGEVQLDSPLPETLETFLQQKLDAFFAPVLDAGGVALPEGGSLGRLRSLQSAGVVADQNWLAVGIKLPNEFLEQWLPTSR